MNFEYKSVCFNFKRKLPFTFDISFFWSFAFIITTHSPLSLNGPQLNWRRKMSQHAVSTPYMNMGSNNSRTGATLAQFKQDVKSVKKQVGKDPAKAKALLVSVGILTRSGKLSRAYKK